MAKRFTDTDKWKKEWYCGLAPLDKLFWTYITDNCTHVGIWDVNWTLAGMYLGKKLDPERISRTFQKQYTPIDAGRRWFIIDFIPFQYGHLSSTNLAHKGIIRTLQEYGLLNSDLSIRAEIKEKEGASKPLGRGSEALKDMDKDKVTDKRGVQGGEFERFWKAYPLKKGKGGARLAFGKAIAAVGIDAMLAGLEAQKVERDHRIRNSVFTPDWKHPRTWLHQECWTDQVLSEAAIRAMAPPPSKRNAVPAVVVNRPSKPWTCDECGKTLPASDRDGHYSPENCTAWKPLSPETKKEISNSISQLSGKFSMKEALKPKEVEQVQP